MALGGSCVDGGNKEEEVQEPGGEQGTENEQGKDLRGKDAHQFLPPICQPNPFLFSNLHKFDSWHGSK